MRRVVLAFAYAMSCWAISGWVAASARAEIIRPRLPILAERHEELAASHYDKATRLAQARDFAAARVEADKAMALAPTAQCAALLGAIAIELGLPRQALEAFVVAIDLGARRERDDYIVRRLAAMPPTPGSDFGIVRFETSAEGRVRCEDGDHGDAFELDGAQTAIGMTAGRHVVVCRMAGRREARLELEVVARTLMAASIDLAPEVASVMPAPVDAAPLPGPATVVRRSSPELETETGSSALATSLIIGGGVVLVGAVGAHLWGLEAIDRGEAARGRAALDYQGARRAYDEASSDLELRRALAIGGYAVGGVALGIGIALALSEDGPDDVGVRPLFDGRAGGAACALSF